MNPLSWNRPQIQSEISWLLCSSQATTEPVTAVCLAGQYCSQKVPRRTRPLITFLPQQLAQEFLALWKVSGKEEASRSSLNWFFCFVFIKRSLSPSSAGQPKAMAVTSILYCFCILHLVLEFSFNNLWLLYYLPWRVSPFNFFSKLCFY